MPILGSWNDTCKAPREQTVQVAKGGLLRGALETRALRVITVGDTWYLGVLKLQRSLLLGRNNYGGEWGREIVVCIRTMKAIWLTLR